MENFIFWAVFVLAKVNIFQLGHLESSFEQMKNLSKQKKLILVLLPMDLYGITLNDIVLKTVNIFRALFLILFVFA